MSASIKILVLLLFQLALSKLYHRNHFPQTLISLAQTYDRDKAKTCLQKRVQSVAITLRLELHTKYTTLHVLPFQSHKFVSVEAKEADTRWKMLCLE